ncbi:MAG: response regulator [Chloroflexota bacterium]|nr:response regulator [Chloroflexota bacterium]
MSETKDRLVLIVEDAVELAQISQITLNRIGLKTFHAVNGQRALEFLSENTPDLMLLDIGLPGMNGWEVLERLKLEDHAGDFPIIVLTAAGDPVNRLIGKLQERVKRYIVKPYSIEELSTAVREVLEIG